MIEDKVLKELLPPSTIGIVGGGQLAKMMAIAAKQMGYKVIVLDPSTNCCSKSVVDELIVANYDDKEKLIELANISDVITYEFENIDYQLIKELEANYNIPQGSLAQLISQHRLTEKEFAKSNYIKTPKFESIKSITELEKAITRITLPAILKTCRLGYDGKGQITINNENDLNKEEVIKIVEQGAILEEMINFEKEISVVVTRSINGSFTFPIQENIHQNKILKYTIVPSNIDGKIEEEAKKIAIKIVESLDYYGTLAVEFFIKDKKIYFNEMAPRPHNSGHYSIEGCNYSQFYTHIKAICGLKLNSIELLQDSVMLNILGQDYDKVMDYVKENSDCYLHIYGKDENKFNRKVGHITFTGKNALKNAKRLGEDYEH